MKKSKTKLQNKQQVTGEKVDLRYATIEDLMGNGPKREYAFDTVEAYSTFLNSLDKDALAHEAIKRQTIPSIDRHLLVAKLLSIFRQKHFSRPDMLRKGQVSPEDQPESLLSPIERLGLRPKQK